MDRTILGYHFPKTGGTTLSGHIRTTLGDKAVLHYGPFARVTSFFAGQPLLEELPDRAWKSCRLVFGHGVDESTIHLLPRSVDLDFVYVTRDVVRHYKSRLKHRESSERLTSGKKQPKGGRDHLTGSPVMSTLVARFPSFVADGAQGLEEQAISVLRAFRFALSTDCLNEHLRAFMDWVGAPPDAPARRVRNTAEAEIGLEEAEILRKCAVDQSINDQLKAGRWDPVSQATNAFGFDPAAKARALARLADSRPSHNDQLMQGYRQLVTGLRLADKLLAGQMFLERGLSGVQSPDMLRVELEKVAAGPAGRRPMELVHRAEFKHRHGLMEGACIDVEAALAQLPESPVAHRVAAEIFLTLGRLSDAKQHVAAALAVNPRAVVLLKLKAQILNKAGDSKGAAAAMEQAKLYQATGVVD